MKNQQSNCQSCNMKIEENFNFCPYCGEPLSDLAKEISAKQASIAQLKLLNVLAEKIENKKDLNLIEKLAEQYKKNA